MKSGRLVRAPCKKRKTEQKEIERESESSEKRNVQRQDQRDSTRGGLRVREGSTTRNVDYLATFRIWKQAIPKVKRRQEDFSAGRGVY